MCYIQALKPINSLDWIDNLKMVKYILLIVKFLSMLFFLAASVALLHYFVQIGNTMIRLAPEVYSLQHVDVPASLGEVDIGWQELGQRSSVGSAESRHVKIRYDDGTWILANLARYKRTFIASEGGQNRYMKRWSLQKGDELRVGPVHIRVEDIGDEFLVLDDLSNGRRIKWFAGMLQDAGKEGFLRGCRSESWRIRRMASWNSRDWPFISRSGDLFLFSLGGGVNCPDRWHLPEVPPFSAQVVWRVGQFWLAPGWSSTPVLMRRQNGEFLGFRQLEVPINQPGNIVQQLVLGRTAVALDHLPGVLRFTPISKQDVWVKEDNLTFAQNLDLESVYKKMCWVGQGPSLQQWYNDNYLSFTVVAMVALVLVVFLLVIHVVRRQILHKQTVSFIFKVLGIVPFVAYLAGVILVPLPGLDLILQFTLLGWVWATLLLALRGRLVGRLGFFWLVAIALASIGTLTLTQLAAGAENSRWLEYARKHALVIGGFGYGIAALSVVRGRWLRFKWLQLCTARPLGWRLLRATGIVFVVVFLTFQGLFGSEVGVFGFQPAEFAKFILAFIAGYVGMYLKELRWREHEQAKHHSMRYALKFFFILAVLLTVVIFVLISVRELSTILILLVAAASWWWRLASHPLKPYGLSMWLNRMVILAGIAAVFAGTWWLYQNPEILPENFAYRDRIMAWCKPELFPHTGAQVRQSMWLVGDAGWWGAGASWYGLNGEVMSLPVVQNDFIATFFINKFGYAASMVLMGVQAVYVYLLLSLSGATSRWGRDPVDAFQRQVGEILASVLHALAWMHVAQWIIAWANALGLLPVIGQPMTWIASANSHMFAFGLPTLFLAIAASMMNSAKVIEVPVPSKKQQNS